MLPKQFARSLSVGLGGLTLAVAGPALAAWPMELNLTVRDAVTHRPIPGVAVQMSAQSARKPADLTSDDAGQVHYALPPAPTPVYARVRAGGHVPVTLNFRDPAAVPAKYDLNLTPGVAVGGRVVDEAGHGIGGATVVLVSRSEGPTDRNAVERAGVSFEEIKTAADGAWTYAGLPADFARLEIGLLHPDYVCHAPGGAGFYALKPIEDKPALLNRTLALTLESGRPVHGTVVDEAGQPVAGCKIGIGNDRVATNVVPEVVTDDAGHFTLHARPGEPVTLTARVGGHAPQQASFRMPDGEQAVTLTMGPKRSLKGRVIDEAGKPVEGAYVFIDGWRGTRTVSKQLRVDKSGGFSWSNAPDDEVLVDVMSDGYTVQRGVKMVWSRDNVVTLRAPMTVDATVLDAETGQPVTAFTVVPGIDFGGGRAISWQREDYGAGDVVKVSDPAGHFRRNFDQSYPAMALRVEADGYQPAESPGFPMNGGPQTYAFKLNRGQSVSVTVTDTAGKPVAGAVAAIATPGVPVSVENGKFSEYDHQTQKVRTDAAGRLTFPPQAGVYRIVVLADAGSLDLTPADVAAGKPLALRPWATVEGTARIGSKHAAGATIDGYGDQKLDGDWQKMPRVSYQYTTTADADGRFKFGRVVPMAASFGRHVKLSDNSSTTVSSQKITPTAGQTATVTIGGVGRPVVGKLVLPDELVGQPWGRADVNLMTQSDRTPPPYPDGYAAMPAEQQRDWFKTWRQTEAGKAWVARIEASQAAQKYYTPVVAADGSFRADDVEAGTYTLTANLRRPVPGNICGIGDPMGRASARVVVPAVEHGTQSDEPVVVPPLSVAAVEAVAVGQAAPDFSVPTLDGKTVSLKDFAGQYVLLDFWATWCGPCVAEVPNLVKVHAAHGGSPKFAMLSLSLDNTPAQARAFAAKNGMAWPQGFVGQETATTAAYGVEGIPSCWLIGPDGKVIAKDLRGDAVDAAIKAALGG